MKDALPVGIPDLDDDHAAFIALCRRLGAEDGSPVLVERLVAGALAHMRREEAMLRAAAFDSRCRFAFDLHMADHRRTRERLRALRADPSSAVRDLERIAEMQHGHIIRHDIKFRAYLEEIAVPAAALRRA